MSFLATLKMKITYTRFQLTIHLQNMLLIATFDSFTLIFTLFILYLKILDLFSLPLSYRLIRLLAFINTCNMKLETRPENIMNFKNQKTKEKPKRKLIEMK